MDFILKASNKNIIFWRNTWFDFSKEGEKKKIKEWMMNVCMNCKFDIKIKIYEA